MTAAEYPDPGRVYPIDGCDTLVFLKNVVKNPNISVGDFTYYDATGAPETNPEDFETQNVLYHFDFIGDKLLIGSFCAIGSGTHFIMNGANHELNPITTYPFGIFRGGWAMTAHPCEIRGNTVVGSDVWIGFNATILPGRSIGHGAIVGAGSMVTKDVPPYAIVGGNPARLIRHRFDEATITRLLALAWWDWPVERIVAHLDLITGGDLDALERAAGED